MIPVLDAQAWLDRALQLERPGGEAILAFYNHRVGAICRDPRLMNVPLDDHIVHRGDGVFETLRFTQRKVIHLDAHLARLNESAQGLELELPCPLEEIRRIILEVAAAGVEGRDDVEEGNIRLLVGRGLGGFGLSPAECSAPTLYVAAYRVKPHGEDWYARGLTAFRSRIPVKHPLLARLKTPNYLSAVLMSLEARRKGMDVPLSFDSQNCLCEAPIANVAVVDTFGTLVMPEFRNALTGTTALKAVAVARSFMEVTVRPIPSNELDEVREVLLLGTAHECVAITHFEGRPIGRGEMAGRPGPVSRRLREALRAALLAEGTAF